MRVAFIVRRRNYYRSWATLIDAALKRGWPVELWLDRYELQEGAKADGDDVPLFRHGHPETFYFESRECLALQWTLREMFDGVRPDVVVSNDPPPERRRRGPGETLWVCEPVTISNFTRPWPQLWQEIEPRHWWER